MKVISVIEDEVVIKKILKHLGLWPVESLKVEREMKPRPPPKPTQPTKIAEYSIDYSTSQLPMPARRPCGGSDNWPPYQVRGRFMLTSSIQRVTYLRRDLSGVPPCMIFQMGMPVQGRRITFFQTTDVLFAKILPQPCLPTDKGPLPINPISRKNEGLPHHASTLSLTHKAKSPMLRLHKRNFLSLISP